VGGTACLTALYFLLPMTGAFNAGHGVVLVVGLAAVAGLLVAQVIAILRSAHPLLRGIGALAVSFQLFVLTFAATYYLMGKSEPGAFNAPLTRLDALYFTVTVFATVGFGDIAALSQAARAVVTVQMLGDLVFLGLAVRVLAAAARYGAREKTSRR
jgi:voltage-gated potassium channel